MTLFLSPSILAKQLDYIREVQPNRGRRVNGIQLWAGGQSGDSWCCEFATMILDICFKGNSPIPLCTSVETVYELAKKNRWIVESPMKDDLFIYVNDEDHAHHIGFVTTPGFGIAGNTSADGTSSNGDRVAEHALISDSKHVKFIRYL